MEALYQLSYSPSADPSLAVPMLAAARVTAVAGRARGQADLISSMMGVHSSPRFAPA